MIRILSDATAGHAGEAALTGFMPHEVMGGIMIVGVLGLVLIALGAIGVWLLFKIERHLRK